jgi:hypothetical protein
MPNELEKADLLEAYTALMRGERVPRRYRRIISSPPDAEVEEILKMLRFVRENFRESDFTPPRPGAVERIERAILESVGAAEDEREMPLSPAMAPAFSREPHGSDSQLVQTDYGYEGEPGERARLTLRIITPERVEDMRIGMPLSEEPSVTLGRGGRADIRISDPTRKLSRCHAAFCFDGERVMIVDLNSTNGTYLNGERIESAPIAEGDLIEMGGVTVEVVKVEME